MTISNDMYDEAYLDDLRQDRLTAIDARHQTSYPRPWGSESGPCFVKLHLSATIRETIAGILVVIIISA